MRFLSTSVLATLVAVSFIPSSADAQRRLPRSWERQPSRFSIVGDVLVAQPKGEFANEINTNGYGINVGGLFRLDREGILSIRGDIGGMQYGSERFYVPYLPITGRVDLDIVTSNNVFWGSIGPQIQVPVGRIEPYMNAAIGFMNFNTSTSVKGSNSQYRYARTTNSDDATSAWILGGGAYVRLGSQRFWKLHVGARYFYGGDATYLAEGDIQDNDDGSITLFPHHSKTDQVTWQVGVAYTFPQPYDRRRR